MGSKTASFQIFTETDLQSTLRENGTWKVTPPFFLLVQQGELHITDGELLTVQSYTISVFAKEESVFISGSVPGCRFTLIQYRREYIRSMSLKLDLLDAFKYVYSTPELTFRLSPQAFEDLWVLSQYILSQLKSSSHSHLEEHLLRHLNYSFLYSSIHKMNQTKSFEAVPRNQQQNIVLNFLKNLRSRGNMKLNVSDYAQMQHITTRHLSATVKQVTGMSALDLIHRMIIHRAKNELTETNLPISEIAYALGYTDPYTFSHFFKKKTGFNPTEFRTKFQG